MEKDPQFVPVDPDEPIPTAPSGQGATDAGLGGIDVTDQYFGPDAPALTVAGFLPLSWSAAHARMLSYLGSRPPGWLRENVNDFTQRFYGNNTKAAWCLIFVWCILNDFFKTTWKLAFVPWLYKIPGKKSGHSGIKVGAICAIAEYSHVGFCVADHGDYFDLCSGNSSKGASQDAITVKRYPKSIISGYVNVDYTAVVPATAPTDAWFAGAR
jgi:hypothetical protein